jgi:hypothetical protein
MSGFQSALSNQDATSLLQTFAPYVWLHPEEENYPCSVDWYLARVTLGFAQAGSLGYSITPVLESVDQTSLVSTTFDGIASGGALGGAVPAEDSFFVLPVTDDSTYAGQAPPAGAKTYPKGSSPPVYGGVIDRYDSTGAVVGYDLVYAFFFAYNGLAMFDPGIGTHEGDLEHIVVRVALDKKTLLAVYYRQHAGDDPYNGWYYPPGPDTAQDGDTVPLFEAHTPQRCVVYCAQGSHASYPYQSSFWWYWRGRDVVGQGCAWDTAQNVLLMNDTQQQQWLDYSGRFGTAPTATAVFSGPPTSPIVQGWQNVIASGPFVDREIYCQYQAGQSSRVSQNFYIAQTTLSWAFDDPNGWLSLAQLDRITVNLSHDTGNDQRAITAITNGCTKVPPYAHTDNVYVSDLVYVDASGKTHTGYSDAWKAITADSSAPTGATVSFRIVCTWVDESSSTMPQIANGAAPRTSVALGSLAAAPG